MAGPIEGPGTFYRDANAFTLDYIAGLQAGAKVGEVRAGYIGTQGQYASARVSHAFASSTLTERLDNLSYLAAGLQRLDLLPDGSQPLLSPLPRTPPLS